MPCLLSSPVLQHEALKEIDGDMASDLRMLRMLQGDVGSGKTIVALLAMLNAVEAGCQAGPDGAHRDPRPPALRHHSAPGRVGRASASPSLPGRDKGKVREGILEHVADGTLPILIGTHALFQEDVGFKDLAIAVVDEQHRFGVHQRLALSGKGQQTECVGDDGDPDPPGRLLSPFMVTWTVPSCATSRPGANPSKRASCPVIGLKMLWPICKRRWTVALVPIGCVRWWKIRMYLMSRPPKKRYRHLSAALKGNVGLVHGRMKGPEKDEVHARFSGRAPQCAGGYHG